MPKHQLCKSCKNTHLKSLYYQDSGDSRSMIVVPGKLYCPNCDKIFGN